MTKFPPEKTQPPQQESTTAQVLRQAQFEAFFAAANAGMMILDSQLRYVQINEAMAELNGICVADHIGRSLREMLPELAATLEPMLQEILDTGKPILDYEVAGETPSCRCERAYHLPEQSRTENAGDIPRGSRISV